MTGPFREKRGGGGGGEGAETPADQEGLWEEEEHVEVLTISIILTETLI